MKNIHIFQQCWCMDMKKISFVGAGSGAPDLITIRGMNRLKQADVIIYAGSLVNPELLEYAKESCQIYNSAGMTLEEVLDVMCKGYQQGQDIVRLHTGDPSLYGAIREQFDYLEQENIPYEVVPGVSSFVAAAAVIPAEFTLPNISQTVILTRMAGRTPVPERESIRSLAKHQASMAIFLSASMLDALADELIAGGYVASTPVAIVYKASWPDEQVIRTDIQNMAQDASVANITKTAQILVGDFLGQGYSRSKLYDPTFSHEYRTGCPVDDHE